MVFRHVIGFGVAGNFAGHLEQAGEANDFLTVEVKEAVQPKAIFPFYVPSDKAGSWRLTHYPRTQLPHRMKRITYRLSQKLRCFVIFNIRTTKWLG